MAFERVAAHLCRMARPQRDRDPLLGADRRGVVDIVHHGLEACAFEVRHPFLAAAAGRGFPYFDLRKLGDSQRQHRQRRCRNSACYQETSTKNARSRHTGNCSKAGKWMQAKALLSHCYSFDQKPANALIISRLYYSKGIILLNEFWPNLHAYSLNKSGLTKLQRIR